MNRSTIIMLLVALFAFGVTACGKSKRREPKTKPVVAKKADPGQPVAAPDTAPVKAADAGTTKAPDAKTAAADVQETPKDVPPPEPETPVKAALETATQPLDSPDSIKQMVAQADELMKWIAENPEHADAAKAKVTSAYLRLLATGSSAGLKTGPAARALGGDGAQARQLRQALEAIEAAETAGVEVEGLDVKRIGTSIRAMLAADADVKEVEFDHAEAMKIATGETPEGMALRAAWLDRLELALGALRKTATEIRFFAFARRAGRILCRNCSDAHHVATDQVNRFLLKDENKGSVICEEAFEGEGEPKTPQEELERLSKCRVKLKVAEDAEPVVMFAANFLALATVRTAHALVDAPHTEGPLKAAVEKRVKAMSEALKAPVILPLPMITEVLPEDKEPPKDRELIATMSRLGFGGLTADKETVAVVTVSPKDVRTSFKPVVQLEEGSITSLTAKSKYPASGQVAMTLEDLEKEKPDKKTGVVEVLKTKATELKDAEKEFSEKAELPAAKGDDHGAVIEMIVDGEAESEPVIRVLDSFIDAGYQHYRFLKTATHGRTMPMLVRMELPHVRELVKPGYERPLIVGVYPAYVDVWTPARKEKDVELTPDPKAKIPDGVDRFLDEKTKQLVRLRVAIPKKEGDIRQLDTATLETVRKAILYFLKKTGSGPLVHVVAAREKTKAADVLRVARIYQERRGAPELPYSLKVWPETRCGGADYSQARKQPEACPSAVSVAFSKLKIPTTGKAKPRPPGPGFCDKGKISAAMRKRAGAFRFCYQRELQLKKGLEGRVVVKFTIGLDGSLKGAPAVASSTLRDAAVHKCLIKNITKIRNWPKPDGGVCVVRWPFKFYEK